MRKAAWSLALVFAAFVMVPVGTTAGPMPASGLTRAAETLDSVAAVRGRGHLRRHHAGWHHGFHRARYHRVRHHGLRHHRVYRPIYRPRYGHYGGHFHCHRHYRWGHVIRHCHWHRHGHH